MARESHRYWINFTADRAQRPIIWEMSRKFDLIFNIRDAKLTNEGGIMALELIGEPKTIEAALRWFRRKGVQIDPIELDVIES